MDEIIIGDIVEILETSYNPIHWRGRLGRVVEITRLSHPRRGRLLDIKFDGGSGKYGVFENGVKIRSRKSRRYGQHACGFSIGGEKLRHEMHTMVQMKKIPKDGDHISLHEDHEIVPLSAGGVNYKYCRDCKVEVVDGNSIQIQVKVRIEAQVEAGKKELEKMYGISGYCGKDLDELAERFGLERTVYYDDPNNPLAPREENDEELRKRFLDYDCLDARG